MSLIHPRISTSTRYSYINRLSVHVTTKYIRKNKSCHRSMQKLQLFTHNLLTNTLIMDAYKPLNLLLALRLILMHAHKDGAGNSYSCSSSSMLEPNDDLEQCRREFNTVEDDTEYDCGNGSEDV